MRRNVTATVTRLQGRFIGTKSKLTNVENAINLIHPYNTISVSGFVAQGTPETLLRALGERYRQTGTPGDLELVFGGGPGDWSTKGLNHLAQPGMLKRVIGGHYGQVPKIAAMALNNEIEAYCMPLGSISRMLRAAASSSPGHISKVGFGTFIDPEQSGGRLNERSTDNIVEKVTVLGNDYLCYKAIPINVAIIRATTADLAGNLSFEKESLYSDARVIAMAARSSGGVVLAQVERIADTSTLPMRTVHIPGALVDCVVLAEKPEDSAQSFFTSYNPAWSGEIREPLRVQASIDTPKDLNPRKIIARRAALELRPDHIVNLGIGMPEGVAEIAREENFFQFTTLTTEGGVFGGIGASGHDFGPASGADAVVEMSQQFDFYNGGGLDICFLGLAQCGANGDVNVSRLSKTSLTGPGGFIDITQCTPQVVFMGTFRKKGFQLEMEQAHGDAQRMVIAKEGQIATFNESVTEITFSSKNALLRGQRVLYVTERAVFSLSHKGLRLIEIAPGIDIDKDILQQMDFEPVIEDRSAIKIMDPRIFYENKMGLLDDFFSTDKAVRSRVEYDKDSHTAYLNLSGMVINDLDGLEALEDKWKELSNNGTNPFHVIVNYDGLNLPESLVFDWEKVIERFNSLYYKTSTRYTGRTFSRHKLSKNVTMEDIDECWKSFQGGDSNPGMLLDRRCLRESLLRTRHIKASETLMNDLMRGKEVITRDEFPALFARIQEYESQGHVKFSETSQEEMRESSD